MISEYKCELCGKISRIKENIGKCEAKCKTKIKAKNSCIHKYVYCAHYGYDHNQHTQTMKGFFAFRKCQICREEISFRVDPVTLTEDICEQLFRIGDNRE